MPQKLAPMADWLPNYNACMMMTVFDACTQLGYSINTFYHWANSCPFVHPDGRTENFFYPPIQ